MTWMQRITNIRSFKFKKSVLIRAPAGIRVIRVPFFFAIRRQFLPPLPIRR